MCYSNTLATNRKKLDNRASTRVFLGFEPNTKGYAFLNLKNHKIEISRQVIFYENRFPYNLDKESENTFSDLSLPIPQNYIQDHVFLNLQPVDENVTTDDDDTLRDMQDNIVDDNEDIMRAMQDNTMLSEGLLEQDEHPHILEIFRPTT